MNQARALSAEVSQRIPWAVAPGWGVGSIRSAMVLGAVACPMCEQ
jgi:hypothetical protein